MTRITSVDLRSQLGDPQRDAGPGRVPFAVAGLLKLRHPLGCCDQGMVSMLAQLLPGALPQLLVGDRRTKRGQRPHAGFAPGVPHFAKAPLAVRQRAAGAAATGGHFMNLPFASLQGEANDGDARPAATTNMIINCRMILSF